MVYNLIYRSIVTEIAKGKGNIMGATATSTMAIPREHRMEQLHNAYVTAVSAIGGATFDPPKQDYGIDGRISEVRRFPDGTYQATNWLFNCQLKATTDFRIRDDIITYEMEVDAYNRFVTNKGGVSRILIVYCLPKEWENWLCINEEELILKHCCYWIALSGEPSENSRSKTIYIPRKNLFTPEAVQNIILLIKSGEDINGLTS